MTSFLGACAEGNIDEIKQIYEANPNAIYERNELNQNAIAVSILAGKWKCVLTLLRYCRVSPHALDSNGDSMYHLIPRGLKAARPTEEDYAEIREENRTYWTNEEKKERARIKTIQTQNPDLRPPETLLIKKSSDNEQEIFGNLDLFLPKYLMIKYHVVLCRKNHSGKVPAQIASEVDEIELADFYNEESQPHNVKKRLVMGLNENLVRDIGSYL